jgi:hypothetical protein
MLVKICLVCGKEYIRKYRKNRSNNFCSLDCYHNWMVSKSNNSSTKFKKGCTFPTKGKKLSPERYKQLSDAGFFKPKFGEKSGNWKGGRTPLGIAIRTMSEYKNWRTKVFQRDKYICQCCKSTNRKLQVHHIIPFYKILDQYKIKSLKDARTCQLLWDVSNGQTLCVPCHKQTDSYLVNQYTK